MKRNFIFLMGILGIVLLFPGCLFFHTSSATLTAFNGTTLTLDVTVQGVEKRIAPDASDTWAIEWDNAKNYTIDVSAKYSYSALPAISENLTVGDGGSFTWTIRFEEEETATSPQRTPVKNSF